MTKADFVNHQAKCKVTNTLNKRPMFDREFKWTPDRRRRNRVKERNSLCIWTINLILLFYLAQFSTIARSSPEISTTNKNNDDQQSQRQSTGQQQLSCQPGEQRHFNYESSTKVWGSSSRQQVQLRATLRMKCMESPTNTTLKYLVELLSINPAFGDGQATSKPRTEAKRSGKANRDKQADKYSHLLRSPEEPVAEPVFEEVSEAIGVAATRVKRSVSGWFNKTWSSVKDFFVNIFNSSEKTTLSRDQALGEHGIDIAHQCKASGGKDKSPKGMLPIDESVFDDLEPEYYIGASTDAFGTGYVFDGSPGKDSGGSSLTSEFDDDESMDISFFDDPKPIRSKRASGETEETPKKKSKTSKPEEYERMLKLPFVFVQSRLGRIIEVRFSHEESDSSIKNFKRHLCDLFTTNLDKSKSQTNELSPIGKHKTKYVVDSSSDSTAIKDSLLKSSGNGKDDKQSQQLVRALAVVAGSQSQAGESSGTINGVVSRDPNEIGIQGDNSNGLSILRTINSTSVIQLASRAFATKADIEQMQVSVKQVQQINEGRLIGSAGQLGMSLVQMNRLAGRPKRESGVESAENVADIADFLQVSTSFAIELVPVGKLGSFNEALSPTGGDLAGKRAKRSAGSAEKGADTGAKSSGSNNNATLSGAKRPMATREPLVVKAPPSESQEFQRTMRELKQLERDHDFSATTLVAESQREDGQLQRLEIIRDQIQMRLNEETLRNRIRRMSLVSGQQVAASSVGGSPESGKPAPARLAKSNDVGLGLTQLVLGNGVTSKRKGSVYSILGETIELESSLGETSQENSMSRLLLETVRMDKAKLHCRSAIATLDEIRAQANKLETRQPFNVADEGDNGERAAKLASIGSLSRRNKRKLDYCKRVLELMLRLNERRASDLVVELIDDCNERLLAGAKSEELGHGPTSRYYRDLRQQFTELLVHVSKPNESLLDKLMARLDYAKLGDSQATNNNRRRVSETSPQPEFVYVSKDSASGGGKQQKYNKSLLFEEDNYNNNDGAGSLVMTITSLANKNSIRTSKRVEVAEKLLQVLKGSSCSLFNGPDLDIIESMGNFRGETHDEIVGKILHLARRCRHQGDQYAIACVHGLQGQLEHSATQRFLVDQLRSVNSTCTLKSEIVLTLIGVVTADELERTRYGQVADSNGTWPAHGVNRVDETLLELAGLDPSRPAPSPMDRRCLRSLVSYYMSLKLPGAADSESNSVNESARSRRSGRSKNQRRQRRAVVNEGNFWDEAACKRWLIPGDQPASSNSSLASPTDLLDELDDNSIVNAMAHYNGNKRGSRRNQKLMEREADGANSTISASALVRRRHKCHASKTFGPKNAQATLKAEIVNDLVGAKDENKFLARFRLATNFLGNRIDVGRMYLWHQRQVTRAHAHVLGKSLWDTSHGCRDKAPGGFLYMPLFDFNLWLVKVSVGLNLQAEMGFFSNCDAEFAGARKRARSVEPPAGDELELFPTIALRAAGEASAKFVVARAGMSLASQYSYQGNIRVSRQPDSCMSVSSAHQPMNVTFSSWFQLFDNDCHYWGSRNRAEPQATRWRLGARKPSVWIQDECLAAPNSTTSTGTGATRTTGASPDPVRPPQAGISP